MAIAAFLPIIGKIFDRVLPDKAAKDAAKLAMMQLDQEGKLAELDADVKIAVGQMGVNQAEAQHGSIFVAGWRPFVGWICGLALAYHFILLPLMTFIAFVAEVKLTDLPEFDFAQLSTILMGMLGLGGLRTFEKQKGVARAGLSGN